MSDFEMPQETLEAVAQRFRILSDPMRLRILNLLQQGEMTVTQLVEGAESSQPNVSKHLTLMRNAGLVKRRQEGNSAYFSIGAPFVFQLCEIVCEGIKAELSQQQAAFNGSGI